ncbi:MAG: ATP-binding cassette domain-containing protein [Candidatus Onthoplasma sp.]
MLEIKNITKDYQLKDEKVNALKGVSVCFRRHEFVSILGPSGCGKTTLLNIIGGLDRYTSGDLIIEGVSTKNYKDKDWDNYRNHRVGFVFQSYNLIPHQTVLENVELALTLSGIKKKDRRARAIEVLEKVGLGDKLKSKPNQLSGGQMQRVAIARALVNDPEIILADEPTGALDSKTSVQIMDILKEVSKDKLVIMVTHNPELAEKYSSRIIRLLDGELIEDNKPYSQSQAQKEIEKHNEKLEKQQTSFKKTEKKKSMSFFTALGLSFKNLLTKKGRTAMVAFAGSIGIIGIALILAVSAGMGNYITQMQSESLSSYPLTVPAITLNIESLTSRSEHNIKVEDDEVLVYDVLETLKGYGKYNYISSEFVSYVKDYYSKESKQNMLNAINISYTSEMHFITQYTKETILENYGSKLTTEQKTALSALPDGTKISFPMTNSVEFSAMGGDTSSTFFEGLNEKDYILSLYNVHGEYPTNKNEVALVLNENSIDKTSILGMGFDIPESDENGVVSLGSLIGKEYALVLNDAYFNDDNSVKSCFSGFGGELNDLFQLKDANADESKVVNLKVSCVLTLKKDAKGSIFTNGIMYTKDLSNFYHENCKQSEIVSRINTLYSDSSNSSTKFEDNNLKNYEVSIKELAMLTGLGIDVDKNAYNYSSPLAIKQALDTMFNIQISDEQVLDLYLQMYGASETPTVIQFYVKSFDGKEDLTNMVAGWNAKNAIKISLSDNSSLITNMLSNLIDIISYVLIAFAAISLVVSSIMIAIITYTSVIERTKEIGVLRSVGASKMDVSNVFNAETTIIGLLAGVLGVVISALLTIPISLILKQLTGIGGLAVLNILPALILVLISVVLTFIAGLVPARIASKKDPVTALRSE